MDTRMRGDIAEAAVLHALTRHGLQLWVPWSRFGACDLLVENDGGEVVRIQVKSGRVRAGCIAFNTCGTDHGNGPRSYAGCADVFAVHVHETDEQFIVPVGDAPGSKGYLRVIPTANNQRAGVRFARDYRLSDWVDRFTARAPAVGARAARGGAA